MVGLTDNLEHAARLAMAHVEEVPQHAVARAPSLLRRLIAMVIPHTYRSA